MRGSQSKIGDTRVSANGYHYTKLEGRWELTHRIVAEEKLGRPLASDERCRFADKDRNNLSPDNIIVYTAREQSIKRKLAALHARKDEIEAQIEELEAMN